MTREYASDFIPLIKAFSTGKTIQTTTHDSVWEDVEHPTFTGHPAKYRVKPEPREFTIMRRDYDGAIVGDDNGSLPPLWERIRVREVLD